MEGEDLRFAPQSVRFLSGQHVCVPGVLCPGVYKKDARAAGESTADAGPGDMESRLN